MNCLANLDVNLASGAAAALLAVCSVVLVRIARNIPFAGQLSFVLTLAAMLWWLFTVVFDLASQSETCKVGWSLAAWPGIVLVPIAWTFFVFDYSMSKRRIRRPVRIIAYIGLPGLVSVIAVTNRWTHLLYGPDTRLVTEGGNSFVIFDHGPLFFAVAAILYIFLIAALGLLTFVFLKAKKVIRPFMGALIIITAAPVAANLAYIGWGVTVFGFDPTPFTFAVSLIALSWLLVNNSMMDTAAQGRILMFYASQDPVILVDAGGHFVSANPAAKDFFSHQLPKHGATLEHLEGIGPLLKDLIVDGDINSATPIRIGGRVFDPRAVPIDSPIQSQIPLLGWSISLVDITERERSAEVLREALAHAESANRAKTHFLANVSHEIRTPLNGVLGMAAVLSETTLDEEQREFLQAIEDSGQILLTTIGDVLDLSKIEAGKMTLENRPFALGIALEGARALFSARANEKGLSLSVEIHEDLPKAIIGDDHRFRQVLHNLVSNAVKFTQTGSVTLTAEPADNGALLLVRVSDTGPGVSREARDTIFQPFQQADGSDARKFGGTGLGLSISRQLCHLMGGSLQLATGVEQGATFEIRLPLLPATDEPKAETQPVLRSASAPEPTAVDVLVVDDNKTNRLILQKFLSSVCRVKSVSSGPEAIDLARSFAFDVILMDIQMPEMDGVETTQKIRCIEQEIGREPSFIVAVTANAMPEQLNHYLSAGMDEVLAKPVSKEPLLSLIKNL
ncbi:histidine kinase N-terminal 7TM domain-containing protein [Pseudophaeobacter sp. TrK17]|uniref:histidine kinase N-terminal 7TM domain-containing protein n=1 Tax=Pseudophaeobacter sp. TrK17 TaxID=2815167 RepID=UPI0035D11B39